MPYFLTKTSALVFVWKPCSTHVYENLAACHKVEAIKMEIFRKCAERTVMKDFCCAVLIIEDRCQKSSPILTSFPWCLIITSLSWHTNQPQTSSLRSWTLRLCLCSNLPGGNVHTSTQIKAIFHLTFLYHLWGAFGGHRFVHINRNHCGNGCANCNSSLKMH